MILGIDASNIRAGGGLTHLSELLHAAKPQAYGINRVIVWGGRHTLGCLPSQPWLDIVHEPILDGPLPKRIYWQKFKLSQLAGQVVDLLFIPGGTYWGTFKPFITMSQNMLPFNWLELRRYGASWMLIRLLLLRLIQIRSFSRANGVIFLTKYAYSKVIDQIKNLNMWFAIIPHGIDDRFRLAPRPQKPISAYSQSKPFKFLYVSIVDVYKHQWHVAEAVAQLRRKNLPVTLNLVGPAYNQALRRLQHDFCRLDIDNKIINYKGPIPFSQLHKLYHEADAFIFASSCENLPNILLEAMAAGLPIACSNRGPMPEVLEDAGVYFNPERPLEVKAALLTLISQPELRYRIAHNAYTCAKKYTWDRCAKETFSFIAKTVKKL